MSCRMIVGLDTAEGGIDALALARLLAPEDAVIVGVTVASEAIGAAADVRVGLDSFVAGQDDLRGEVVAARSVADGLHEAARQRAADLIVIGSCRRGVVGRVLAGDDVRETMRGAPCPVAVAPRGFASHPTSITTIGFGWGGGEEGAHVIEVVRELADGCGASIRALAVVSVPAWPRRPDGASTGPVIAADVRLERERVAALDGISTTTLTGAGVDHALEHFAAEVDLLVVGSHQRGRVGRMLLGSTSEHLSRTCPVPLLVVPCLAAPLAGTR